MTEQTDTPKTPDIVIHRDAMPWGDKTTFTISGTPEQQAALFAALAEAQGSFPDIPRTKTARVFGTTREGKRYDYTFDYAPLDVILKTLRPHLKANGLAVVTPPAGAPEGFAVGAMLTHAAGARMQTSVRLPRVDDIKKQAGSFTYMQRYCVCGLTGVFADTDDDASMANGEQAIIENRGKPPAPPKTSSQQKAQQTAAKLAKEEEERAARAAQKRQAEKADSAPPPAEEPTEGPMTAETQDKVLTLLKALFSGKKKEAAVFINETVGGAWGDVEKSEALALRLHAELEKRAEAEGVLQS